MFSPYYIGLQYETTHRNYKFEFKLNGIACMYNFRLVVTECAPLWSDVLLINSNQVT